MNKCFKCGTEFESAFCPNCGEKCEGTKICPKCSTKLDGQVKYCNNCGHSFVEHSKTKKVGKVLKNFGQNSKAWIIAHKTLALIIAAVLIVGILLAIILPLTVGNIFRANRIAKINIGDGYVQVEKNLGEPFAAKSNKAVYNYYSGNMLKKLKKQEKLEGKQKDMEDFDDLFDQMKNESKLQQEIDALEHKHISVTFNSDGGVASVIYDAHAINNGESAQKQAKTIELVPSEIPYGMNPQDMELYAKIFYTDGSYKLERVRGADVEGKTNIGWTINWSDSWGEYTSNVRQGTITADTVIKGNEGDFIFKLYPIFDGEIFTGNYKMEIVGEGEIPNQETYAWSELIANVTDLVIGDGITNVPNYLTKTINNETKALVNVAIGKDVTSIGDGAFSDCVNLSSIIIPERVTTIGEFAFSHCSKLTDIVIPDNVTSVGMYAFLNCSSLTSVTIGRSVIDLYYVFASCSDLAIIYWNATNCNESMLGTLGDSFWNVKFVFGESVQSIPSYWYRSINDVYYCGSQIQWMQISGADNLASNSSVTMHYYSEENPYKNGTADDGENYWHWADDGVTPEIWEHN